MVFSQEGRAKAEKDQQQKEQNKFNSVAGKVKMENQNQTHNVVKEGIGPKNQKN